MSSSKAFVFVVIAYFLEVGFSQIHKSRPSKIRGSQGARPRVTNEVVAYQMNKSRKVADLEALESSTSTLNSFEDSSNNLDESNLFLLSNPGIPLQISPEESPSVEEIEVQIRELLDEYRLLDNFVSKATEQSEEAFESDHLLSKIYTSIAVLSKGLEDAQQLLKEHNEEVKTTTSASLRQIDEISASDGESVTSKSLHSQSSKKDRRLQDLINLYNAGQRQQVELSTELSKKRNSWPTSLWNRHPVDIETHFDLTRVLIDRDESGNIEKQWEMAEDATPPNLPGSGLLAGSEEGEFEFEESPELAAIQTDNSYLPPTVEINGEPVETTHQESVETTDPIVETTNHVEESVKETNKREPSSAAFISSSHLMNSTQREWSFSIPKMLKIYGVGRGKKQNEDNEKPSNEISKKSAGELRMQKEFDDLDLPSGFTLTFPNPNDLMKFEVTVVPSEGYWKRGNFRFVFTIPVVYPHDPPKVKCITKIFHPNIDEDGNVCLNVLRGDWKPILSINAILYGLLHLFLEPNPTDPLNHEAADLLTTKVSEFQYKVNRFIDGFC